MYFVSSIGWWCFIIYNALFVTQELYTELGLNDRELAEVRLFGNPLYAMRSRGKTPLQESYIFS